MHAYAGTNLRTQLGFQRAMNGKFSALKLRFGINPRSYRNRSKPPFLNYIKPYMEYFKEETKKILRENTRFIRNSESKK